MKTIIRNFLSLIRRFKVAMFLNIAGLAVAFAAFIVILIQVNYERSFDKCHPSAERVYRVDLTRPGTFSVIHSRAFVEAVISSSPHIVAGSLVNPFLNPIYFTVEKNGEKIGFKEPIATCHATLPQVFDFPIIEGDRDCLEQPNKVLIPESMARKMFGDGLVVGKTMYAEERIWSKMDTAQMALTVGAVYRDFPGNTQLRNLVYTSIDPNFSLTDFGSSNYICYLLLDDAANAKNVTENFNKHFDFSKIGDPNEKINLLPFTDIYYLNESPDGRVFRSGDKDVASLLFCIAMLIIIVAAINFTNFTTALTPLRIKSINTQKVLGSSQSFLRRSLLFEAGLISLAAWIVSLGIVWGLNETSALPFVEASLRFETNIPIILLSGILALVTGIIAGLYPSWYVTSFPPALVLKGSFGLSSSGRKLRTALICIQFVVSILLIISASFVRLQNNYMRHFSLGFDKDQVAIVELSGSLYQKHREAYTNRLKEFAGIEDVAFAMEKVAAQDTYNTNGAQYKGKDFQYFMILCSYNFMNVMGIPVEEGRDFSLADESLEGLSYIFNRPARLAMDMTAGDILEGFINGQLIGFAGDVKFTSLRQGENNIAFAVGLKDMNLPLNMSYIRLKAGTNVHAAVGHIRKTLADLDPSYPFDVLFYDSVFDKLYHKEENFRSMILVFSILAIIISLVGVFGLVVFDTQYRRKEIGIRKVHGATVAEILEMFNKAYLKIVAICFIVAAPVAWYGVHQWLESFAYKTPVYWWVFVLAFLVVALITLATVSFQNWKAANDNPIKSLRSE